MTSNYLYLTLPDYLAQWYAHECLRNQQAESDTFSVPVYRYPQPIAPLRGSIESEILKAHLTKQPEATPTDFKDGANFVLAIPSFRNRDPQIYNYLSPEARKFLYDTMRTRFQVSLWQDIHNLQTAFTRKDLAIQAWMDHHGIEVTDTNYNSVVKIYDRAYATYRKAESRRKSKKS